MRKLIERLEQNAGLGPGGRCKCPACGNEQVHVRGKPCNETKCLKCGAIMGRLA